MIETATRKEMVKALIDKRNIATRKDYERRYGKVLPEIPEEAREARIMNNPDCWDKI